MYGYGIVTALGMVGRSGRQAAKTRDGLDHGSFPSPNRVKVPRNTDLAKWHQKDHSLTNGRESILVALTRIHTDPGTFTRDPITDDEAAAMFRASVNLFAQWGLKGDQPAILLNMTSRTYGRRKKEGRGDFDRDVKARLSNLMGIHKALRLLFREPSRGYAWIRSPNTAFGGRSALEVMMGGDLTDLMRVRRYLDAERGTW